VSDYSVYVRNPADLSTIKFRLDGSLPTNLNVANIIGEWIVGVKTVCFSAQNAVAK